MMWNDVQKRVNRAVSKIKVGIIGRISSILKDSNEVFIKTSPEDELRDIRIITPYGLKCIPLVGLDAQVIFNNSSKKASLIGIDGPSPIKLDIGEVILYNTKANTYIHLKNDKKIYFKGDLEIKGKLNIDGDMTSTGDITIDGNISAQDVIDRV